MAEEVVVAPRSVELSKDINLDDDEYLRGYPQAILV